MIEQLRPLRGYMNSDILPVIELLTRLDDAEHNTITQTAADELLSKYKKSLKDLEYLVEHGIIHTELVESNLADYSIVTMDKKYYDEQYDQNLIENAKTILNDLTEPTSLYALISVLITRYPVEDIPYIIELLEFESIIGDVYI